MMMKWLVTVLCLIALLSCKDTDDGLGYPKGMRPKDMQSTNDCSLPECSSDRIARLVARDVVGKINESIYGGYVISYAYSFDSYIAFYLCDLPEEFQEAGLEVIFDGEALDACGYYTAGFPAEEVYILKIHKIKKI